MNKIRREDTVIVIAGRDKGAQGVVREVYKDAYGKPERVRVEGVNMVSRHTRPNPQKNEPGGVVKKEAPLHVSNVAVVDPESGKPARVKIKTGDNGKKERVFHVGAGRRA